MIYLIVVILLQGVPRFSYQPADSMAECQEMKGYVDEEIAKHSDAIVIYDQCVEAAAKNS